jgi:hypothetical protein
MAVSRARRGRWPGQTGECQLYEINSRGEPIALSPVPRAVLGSRWSAVKEGRFGPAATGPGSESVEPRRTSSAGFTERQAPTWSATGSSSRHYPSITAGSPGSPPAIPSSLPTASPSERRRSFVRSQRGSCRPFPTCSDGLDHRTTVWADPGPAVSRHGEETHHKPAG